MIIWRGAGLLVLVYIGVSILVIRLFFESNSYSTYLRFGLALILSAGLILLTFWKDKLNDKKLVNSNNQEKYAKYKSLKESNPMMNLNDAALFFIPLKFWPYLLSLGGIVYLVLYFFK